MWMNSMEPDQYPGIELPEISGWSKTDDGYSIEWEAVETSEKIQNTLDFLNKDRLCKTGCKTMKCSCKKRGRECGSGCECRGCTNLSLSQPIEDEEDSVYEDDTERNCEELESEEITF